MATARKSVTFYHSVICPRCRVSGLALRRALASHPEIELEKVEFLTNRGRAAKEGVKTIPALVASGRTLTGIVLTRTRIERFFESLGH
jgi:hypothetical protein